MRSLRLTRIPALCREEEIIDWMLDQEGASKDPEEMAGYMLSAMPTPARARERALGWTESLQNSFPAMARQTSDFLRTVTPTQISALHEKTRLARQARATKDIMNEPPVRLHR